VRPIYLVAAAQIPTPRSAVLSGRVPDSHAQAVGLGAARTRWFDRPVAYSWVDAKIGGRILMR